MSIMVKGFQTLFRKKEANLISDSPKQASEG
jgi:hypothetical protein